jgi:hypothetical protein
MIKKIFYTMLLVLMPALASANPVTLASWGTPTNCIITCTTYTAPDCPVSGPTVTTLGCNPLTGYRFHAGTSHGAYSISSDVTVTNAAALSTAVGSLPRGYICFVVTALTAAAESDYSSERCFWNLGNYAYSNNATRPVPAKPTGAGGGTGGGTDVSDNFNRANANPIGGNWTTVPGAGALQIVNNQVQGVGTSNTVYWNANVFSATQCSRVTMVDLGATYGGPAVRVSTTQHSYYYFKVANSGTSYEYGKVVNGIWSQLGANVTGTPQANDVLTICASGSTLTGYVNGTLQATRSDTDLSSGRAGFGIFGTVTHLDNWHAWDGGYK